MESRIYQVRVEELLLTLTIRQRPPDPAMYFGAVQRPHQFGLVMSFTRRIQERH